MNATYAYFTAQANSAEAEGTVAIIKVGLTNNEVQVNSVTVADNSIILPGDEITLKSRIVNSGTASIYSFIAVYWNKSEDNNEVERLGFSVYSFDSNKNLIKMKSYNAITSETTETNMQVMPFELASNEYVDVSLPFTYDGASIGNSWQGVKCLYTLKVYSIQTAKITEQQAYNELLTKINSDAGIS